MPKNKGGNAKGKDKGAKGGDAGDDSGAKASKGGTAVKVSALHLFKSFIASMDEVRREARNQRVQDLFQVGLVHSMQYTSRSCSSHCRFLLFSPSDI